MTAAVERQVAELVRRCYRGLDAAELRTEIIRRVTSLLSVDATFFATVDPATLLFTSAVAEEPLSEATALFLDNEFGREDVNKFAALARSSEPIASLDQSTEGRRGASPRYREIMAPLGLGDELRIALIAGGRCWGVLCLHREDSRLGFTPAETALLEYLGPHLAEGLRRAVAAQRGLALEPTVAGPGVVVLGADFAVLSKNEEAEHWLAELDSQDRIAGTELPIALYAAAAQLASVEGGHRPPAPPTALLQTGGGRWVSIHASRMDGAGGAQVAVVLDSATPSRLSSLFLDAQGLTPAQARVASLVLQGRSTQQIVNELRISAYTVQEHLGIVFEKFGVGSRRELVATLLGQR